MFKDWDELVLGAVELLLGEEFMNSMEHWRTNVDIVTHFLVALFDLEVPTAMVLLMAQKLV